MTLSWIEELPGNYLLTKQINKPDLRIIGLARFITLKNNYFLYEEKGEYFFSDIKYNFSQKQLFLFIRNKLQILSQDGEILYEIPLDKVKNFSASHLCGLDNYQLYFSLKEDKITMKYLVSGERKNYTIINFLEKISI
jgi:hypothetical protein